MWNSVSRGLSRFQTVRPELQQQQQPLKELGHLDRDTLWQVEKSPVPHIWRSCFKPSGTKGGNFALFSSTLPPLPRTSDAPYLVRRSYSSSSFFSFSSLIQRRPRLLFLRSSRPRWEVEAPLHAVAVAPPWSATYWRISCWEPPVVKAEKCAGGRWANNELLDHLCATTWPECWKTSLSLFLSPTTLI